MSGAPAIASAPVTARTADGVELALFHVAPGGAAVPPHHAPPLLLVHGTFSNRTYFLGTKDAGLAHDLARRGFDAWVAELRGHGRSGAAGRRNSWHFEDWIRYDAPALVSAVLEATGRDRVIWIGHSAGGAVGVAWLARRQEPAPSVAALVLAGTPAPTGLDLAQYPMAAAVLAVTALTGRFPARILGLGPEDEHAGIMRQWMRWNLRRRWQSNDGTDYLAGCSQVTIPLLALAGGGDWLIAPPDLCRDLVDALGSRDKTFVTCGRAEGFAADLDHAGLLASAAARREVWPLIGDWLATRFP